MPTTKVKDNIISAISEDKHEEWFSFFINRINESIHKDKTNLEQGTASKETIAFYKSLQDGNHIKGMSYARRSISQNLIMEMVLAYVNHINEKQIALKKLALDISDNKVLAWAEIAENDEKSEMALIRIESMVNGKFAIDTGIHLDSIIVEDCDNLPVPAHYKIIQVGKSE